MRKICAICGKQFNSLYANAKYCSRVCYHKSTIKYPTKQCPICKKQFLANPAVATKFCSRKCWNKDLETKRIKKVCPACGKQFEVPHSYAKRFNYCSKKCRFSQANYTNCLRCGKTFRISRKDRHFCSEICRRPPIIVKCLSCGKAFRKTPTSLRLFCDRHCYHVFKGENRLEKRFRQTLEKLNIPFKQEVPFGRFYSVDFTIAKAKIAIEVDGDYWHNQKKDDKKDAFLRSLGWNVVRFKQSELDKAPNIGEFVLERLENKL